MSDEKNGGDDSKAGPQMEAASGALSGRTRSAPVIEGAAVEIPPPEAEPEAETPPPPEGEAPESASELPIEAASDTAAAPEEAPAEKPKSKNLALTSLTVLIGLAVLGAGGYYSWTQYLAPDEAPLKIAEAPRPVEAGSPPISPGTETPPEIKSAATSPVEPPKKAEAEPPPAPVAAEPASSEPASSKPVESKSVESKPVAEKPVEAEKTPVGEPAVAKPDDKAQAQLAAQLAAAQAALEQVSQRLQKVEGQLAAPKSETRAALAARDAGPAGLNEASARLVVAQSVLAALRQGEDYAPQLTALQSLGGDAGRLARLRAGLAAPSGAKLAATFVALAPKIVAVGKPASPAPQEAKPTHGFGEAVWAYVEARAQKIVKVRPAGAPELDETDSRIDSIEQKLAHGDLAAALAERSLLSPPALVLTADWAKDAQTRLDAESAARAEAAEALQVLSKAKS